MQDVTYGGLWKVIITNYGIAPYTCVMNRSGPSGNNKREPHIKITHCHNIFTCVTFPIPMLGLQLLRHNHLNVCSINGSNSMLKMRPKLCFCKYWVWFRESWINWSYVITGHAVYTLQNLVEFLLMTERLCANRSATLSVV